MKGKSLMKKYLHRIVPILILVIAVSTAFVLSGFSSKSSVSEALDSMFDEDSEKIYGHTMFYEQQNSETYNDIVDMGEGALKELLTDFVDHPYDDVRKQLIIDLISDIASQNNIKIMRSDKNMLKEEYLSTDDWFEMVGNELYTKYVGTLKDTKSLYSNDKSTDEVDAVDEITILRGEEFEFEPGTYIPEPTNNQIMEEGIKWEPHLGCYVLENIYYDEVNQYFYMTN